MYFFLPMVDLRQVPGTDDLSSEEINLLFPLESIRMVRDGLQFYLDVLKVTKSSNGGKEK